MEHLIAHIVDTLQQGGTLLYPTDTIWGIGCDARNREAVERLYAIKQRDHSKSMLILCSDSLIDSTVWQPQHSERPTTYILPYDIWHRTLRVTIADNLCAADGSLGIRIPKHLFCQQVIEQLGAPLVSTSANLSGHPSPASYEEIEEELKRRVDSCVPPLPEFRSSETQGSRIVKMCDDGTYCIIRP